jgi:sodium pump decarboxylase gamma subunit
MGRLLYLRQCCRTCLLKEEFMIVEGIELSIIGILFVYAFLFLLVVVMRLSSNLLKPYTDREVREQAMIIRKSSAVSLLKDSRLKAVIGAAVAAHRKRAQG